MSEASVAVLSIHERSVQTDTSLHLVTHPGLQSLQPQPLIPDTPMVPGSLVVSNRQPCMLLIRAILSCSGVPLCAYPSIQPAHWLVPVPVLFLKDLPYPSQASVKKMNLPILQ